MIRVVVCNFLSQSGKKILSLEKYFVKLTYTVLLYISKKNDFTEFFFKNGKRKTPYRTGQPNVQNSSNVILCDFAH